ncbi:hypothetical protein [Natrarchaeobius chitinivorans]|nr:hypothetical protein [Natrarchaeobius chitinivorans]
MGVSSDQFQWDPVEVVDDQLASPTDADRWVGRETMRAKRVSTYGGP